LRYLYLIPAALSVALGVRALTLTTGDEASAAEQEAIGEACRAPEQRQFDFWLGDWEVTDTAGQVVGTNSITRIANGCGLLESWRSAANGNEGNSINWYNPQTAQWYQTWVGGGGSYLEMEGGIEDGDMILSGERETPRGKVIDRVTWIPKPDGRVQQIWEVSRDEGQTWQVVFNGMYRRR
jgi:hypothetical protein